MVSLGGYVLPYCLGLAFTFLFLQVLQPVLVFKCERLGIDFCLLRRSVKHASGNEALELSGWEGDRSDMSHYLADRVEHFQDCYLAVTDDTKSCEGRLVKGLRYPGTERNVLATAKVFRRV